jgi:hypothetical protein
MLGSLVVCSAQQIFMYVDKTEEELDRACGKCDGEEICFQGLGWETGRKGTTCET